MSGLISLNELEKFESKVSNVRCGLCPNNCQMTIHRFGSEKYFTGNKCDKPTQSKKKSKYPNMVKYKYERLFYYSPLTKEAARRGSVGIPRGLNMYEHYPFWFTFFTSLSYQVIISEKSSKKVYESGMDTIPSESLCYPAKLVNGHVKNLIDRGLDFIFYPGIIHEAKDDSTSQNFSCPIVTSYPEVIANNMDELKNIKFEYPFLTFYDEKSLTDNLVNLHEMFDATVEEVKKACLLAFKELKVYQKDINDNALKTLAEIEEKNLKAVVLAGRPYHIDPEINHGLDLMVNSFDMAVLTEDNVSFLESGNNLRVINQWVYHSRLYKAASFVGKTKNIEMIQLNSFGCGIDAITTDQVKEILQHHNKLYTCLKIDEGSNLGAAKIRLRSLKAAVLEREDSVEINPEKYDYKPTDISGDIKDYTILCPQMSPLHFDLFEHAMKSEGLNFKVLPSVDRDDINTGLKYVNNDSCYPAIVVIGQLLKALEYYDLDNDKVALIISQTGGGCRASNYISLLRKALSDMKLDHIPVISFNSGNVDDINSIDLNTSLIKKLVISATYGDMLLKMSNRTRAHELTPGDTDLALKEIHPIIVKNVISGSYVKFRSNINKVVNRFDEIKLDDINKPKVGIVGEILVKYHPTANNQLIKVIEENGGEAVVPEFIDFFLYSLQNAKFRHEVLYPNKVNELKTTLIINLIEMYRTPINKALKKSKNFTPFHNINETVLNAKKFLSLGNQTGEGWFLTGEMVNLIEDGVPNIICTQPFGCLPNHITGKGMFKTLRESYEEVNIVAIDYDPGASEVNQINRIKLMMTVAKKNINK